MSTHINESWIRNVFQIFLVLDKALTEIAETIPGSPRRSVCAFPLSKKGHKCSCSKFSSVENENSFRGLVGIDVQELGKLASCRRWRPKLEILKQDLIQETFLVYLLNVPFFYCFSSKRNLSNDNVRLGSIFCRAHTPCKAVGWVENSLPWSYGQRPTFAEMPVSSSHAASAPGTLDWGSAKLAQLKKVVSGLKRVSRFHDLR